jgi:hypothetical protein
MDNEREFPSQGRGHRMCSHSVNSFHKIDPSKVNLNVHFKKDLGLDSGLYSLE